MRNFACLLGHDYKKVASLIREVNYYKNLNDENSYTGRLTGTVDFVFCKNCDHCDVMISVGSGKSKDLKDFTHSMTNNSKVVAPMILKWKSGDENPIPDKFRMMEGLTIHNPIYFTADAVDSFALSIHESLSHEDKKIVNTQTTQNALKEVETALEKLQTIIKLQKK